MSQSYCCRSIRILFAQCPFLKHLFDCLMCIDLQSVGTLATMSHHVTPVFWLRILNLIGFAVHDITLLSRSPETCGWRGALEIRGCSLMMQEEKVAVCVVEGLNHLMISLAFLEFDNSNAATWNRFKYINKLFRLHLGCIHLLSRMYAFKMFTHSKQQAHWHSDPFF